MPATICSITLFCCNIVKDCGKGKFDIQCFSGYPHVQIYSFCLVFRIERPILGDNPKPHKFACSGRQPSLVTEA